MNEINKTLRVRTALGMTPTEFGRKILRIENSKAAYDTVYMMEKSNSNSAGTGLALDILLLMVQWRDQVKPGCSKAISELLKLADNGEL